MHRLWPWIDGALRLRLNAYGSRPARVVPVPAGIRPVGNFLHEPVFHWVPVRIGHAGIEIVFVSHEVFPEAALPDAAFAGAAAWRRVAVFRQGFREVLLDQAPARGEIRIALGQGPDAMEMIGQDADRHGVERPCPGDRGIGGPKAPDFLRQQTGPPVLQGGGKEIRAARHIETTIIRHGPFTAWETTTPP